MQRPRWLVIGGIGIGQILAWGSSYYLIAVLAGPIAAATGWPLPWVVGGASLGFLVSGLLSPRIGRLIEAEGGRRVLPGSAVLLALGLATLAAAPNLPVYFAGWLVIGAGMGAGLYDPAFASLGRIYGEGARGPITTVTLFGGFASTVCWPLWAWLTDAAGWRGACLAFAAIHLLLVLPLYRFVLPPAAGRAHARPRPAAGAAAGATRAGLAFVLVASSMTLAAVVMTMIAVHLLTLLQARGVSLAAAVALGALLGPSQVFARLLELAVGRGLHPVWTMLASTLLVALGLVLLLVAPGFAAAAIVIYGTGSGIRSIVRGTVPLALFGPHGYATLMGRLARPALIAQAATPALGGLLIARMGAQATMLLLVGAALLNILPAALLIPWTNPRRAGVAASGPRP
ncbi:MAG: MFS transporter [Rhodospirillales bacterium]|nr:MFS transporter [Rhodospirillales bacterium]